MHNSIGELIFFYVVTGLLMNFVAHANKRCGFEPWVVALWPVTLIMLMIYMAMAFPFMVKMTFCSPNYPRVDLPRIPYAKYSDVDISKAKERMRNGIE
jgi:hypothetical protein